MKKVAVVAMMLGCLASVPAHAADTYIGAALGVSVWEDKADDAATQLVGITGTSTYVEQKRASAAGKVFAGTWFTDNIGLEFGYVDLGETKFTATFPFFPGYSEKLKQQAQAGYLDLQLGGKIIDSLRLYGKIGAYYADSKATISGNALVVSGSSQSANNAGVHLGVGVDYSVLEHLDIKGTIEYFPSVGDTDHTFDKFGIGLVTVGAAYKF